MNIGIVTPAKNARSVIDSCLSSVNGQSTPVVSHVVVDGHSQDNTIESVSEFRDAYCAGYITVATDRQKGLYDAVNLGIAILDSEIIGILNADDYYASNNVLAKVLTAFEDRTVDACYGDLKYVDAQNTDRVVRYWRAGHYAPTKFYWGWMPPHPTFFVRRSVYERFGGFNPALGSAADYEFMLRVTLKHQIKIIYIPEVLVHMRTGGISNVSLRNRIKAHAMDYKAWKVNGLWPYPWTLPLKPLRKIGQWLPE